MKLHTLAAPASEAFDLLDPVAIDGDTIKATADVGLNVLVRIRVRLRSFYAAEHDGAMPTQAWAAQTLLQAALDSGKCQLRKRGSKMDSNGRWLGWLLVNGKAITGLEVLGRYQLTEAAHAVDLRQAKRNRTGKGGAL